MYKQENLNRMVTGEKPENQSRMEAGINKRI